MTTKEILEKYQVEMIIEQINGRKTKNFLGGNHMVGISGIVDTGFQSKVCI